jgi:hypothetical protein|tara:strand:+ start:5349 stop:6170 length:822 start_codon:yes stop_codon:yes gene_type:complete
VPSPKPSPTSSPRSSADEIDFSTLPEDRSLAPLPVGPTFRGLFACAWAALPAVSRLAALPLLLSFLMGALVHFIGASIFFAALAADLYLSIWFSCAVQRLVLLGPTSTQSLPFWGSREIRYLVKVLGLFGFIFLASLPVTMALAPPPGDSAMVLENVLPMIFALSVVTLTVGSLLGFVLPAAAVGRNYGYGRAFREALGVLPVLILMFLVLILPLDGLTLVANVLLGELEMATSLMVPGLAVAAIGKYLSFAWAATVFAYVFAKRTRFWEETA